MPMILQIFLGQVIFRVVFRGKEAVEKLPKIWETVASIGREICGYDEQEDPRMAREDSGDQEGSLGAWRHATRISFGTIQRVWQPNLSLQGPQELVQAAQ